MQHRFIGGHRPNSTETGEQLNQLGRGGLNYAEILHRTTSYNGFLRFTTWSDGREGPYGPDVLREYPLVQIQGNHRIVLEHYPRKRSNNGRYEIRCVFNRS